MSEREREGVKKHKTLISLHAVVNKRVVYKKNNWKNVLSIE